MNRQQADSELAASLSRRHWWQTTAGAALGLLAGPVVGAASRSLRAAERSAERGPYVDAHVHVWTPEVDRYPLAQPWRKEQMAPPSFTPEELLAHARPCGVGRIVLVQMSYYEFDNSYMLDTIARFPGVFGGIAVIDPRSEPAAEMRRLKVLGVRGFRIRPGDGDPEAWLASPGMDTMWRAAAELDQAVCCLINPNALPAVDRMCERFPDTAVVIDHFARIGIDGAIRAAEVDQLARLARHRRTFVKISAFYALGKKAPPYLDLAPMIRQLRDAFGAERLMWGTDCPYQVDAQRYEDSLALIRDRLDFLSDGERQAMLTTTAERLFF